MDTLSLSHRNRSRNFNLNPDPLVPGNPDKRKLLAKEWAEQKALIQRLEQQITGLRSLIEGPEKKIRILESMIQREYVEVFRAKLDQYNSGPKEHEHNELIKKMRNQINDLNHEILWLRIIERAWTQALTQALTQTLTDRDGVWVRGLGQRIAVLQNDILAIEHEIQGEQEMFDAMITGLKNRVTTHMQKHSELMLEKQPLDKMVSELWEAHNTTVKALKLEEPRNRKLEKWHARGIF